MKTAPRPSGLQASVPVLLESEHAALGAAIRDHDLCEQIVTELQISDFYSPSSQKVYLAIKGLSDEGLEVSGVAVQDRSGVPKTTVDELLESSQGIGPSQAKTLISELQRIGTLRQIYNACVNASSQVSKDSKIEEIVSSLEKGLYAADRTGTSEIADGQNTLQKVVDDFLQRHAAGGGPEISTGLRDLDRAIIGLRPGKLGIIAARPGMGKTALASSIRRAVIDQGYGVIEFALEMSAEELLERELSFQAKLNLRKILSAKDITNDELERVLAARASVVSGRWFIDDSTYSISGICRKARIVANRMVRSGTKLGLVIIDYLQLSTGELEDRQQSLTQISRGCKLLAKELGCTVLALSQLNRSCEYRDDRRPLMSDLRESGAIEQDADWIGFVYREHQYDNSFPPEETEFIIRKHRSGPTGTVRLHYNPKLVSFTDRELPQCINSTQIDSSQSSVNVESGT